MISLAEFVEQCLIKYRCESLPKGETWEDAHHPIPKCKQGIITVPMWKSDHAAHNVIQSEEVGHPCVFGWELEYLVGDYSYLVPFFHKWKKACCEIAGAKAKEMGVGIHSADMQSKGGRITYEKGVGIFDEANREKLQEVRRNNGLSVKEKGLGIFSEGQQALGGKTTQEMKVGLFGLSPEDKKKAERKGGETAGKLPRWTNGTSNRYCAEQPGPEWWRGVTRKPKGEA